MRRDARGQGMGSRCGRGGQERRRGEWGSRSGARWNGAAGSAEKWEVAGGGVGSGRVVASGVVGLTREEGECVEASVRGAVCRPVTLFMPLLAEPPPDPDGSRTGTSPGTALL